MKYDAEIDDEILQNILFRTGIGPESLADSDEADELFALLIEKGELAEYDREQFLRCLDVNSTARRTVSQYMRRVTSNPELSRLPDAVAAEPCATPSALSRFREWTTKGLTSVREQAGKLAGKMRPSMHDWQGQAATADGRSISWTFPFAPRMAMAYATLLFAVTIGALWYSLTPGLPLLAMRGGPSLFDLGESPDAIGAKGDAKQSISGLEAFLKTIPSADRENIAEGYRQLELNHFPEAQRAFKQNYITVEGKYNASLGRANSLYLDQRYDEALKAFDDMLQLKPKSAAARIGKAMTLSAKGQDEQALKEWLQVNAEDLPAEHRNMVTRELARLKQNAAK